MSTDELLTKCLNHIGYGSRIEINLGGSGQVVVESVGFHGRGASAPGVMASGSSVKEAVQNFSDKLVPKVA